MQIKAALAKQTLNSRKEPTIQVILKTSVGQFSAAAPSGASTGSHEVADYTPHIYSAITDFNAKTSGKLVGFPVFGLSDFEKLEKLVPVSKHGGNLVVALEYAVLKALAKDQNKEIYQLINSKIKKFPMPLGNVIGGGAHTKITSDIQEILFSPQCTKFERAVKINKSIHKLAKKELKKIDKSFKSQQTDEGAWVSSAPAIDLIRLASDLKNYAEDKFGEKVLYGIDLAANQLYANGKYHWTNLSARKKRHEITSKMQLGLLGLTDAEFKLDYIEDPFRDSDFKSFAKLTRSVNGLVCADDLTCTKLARLNRAVKYKVCDAVVIKPNQIGSLIKTLEFAKTARRAGLKTVVSHRSGTTNDTVLTHLALATQANFFKCGIAGKERVAKLKEMIRLERKIYH